MKPQIEALQKEYFIVTPIIDGHGDDWNNAFISIRKSAEKVIEKSGHGEISLMHADRYIDLLKCFF